MATKYKYRGYIVYCCGYHQPDHCVWWEAVDEKTNAACFHGHTRHEVFSMIDESIVEDEWKAKLAEVEDTLHDAKNLLERCKQLIKPRGHNSAELIADIDKFLNTSC